MRYLITGGTGTFGTLYSEFLLLHSEGTIVIYSRDEEKQRVHRARFTEMFGSNVVDNRLRYFLGDVRDATRLNRAMSGVDYVIHAAALKQIPATEYNPREAVMTNIVGAMNVVEAAIDNRVKRVIALGTDKQVAPVNLYGATKLCAEKLFIQANVYSKGTIFAVTRYGNVLGSRGSVLEIWGAADEIQITRPDATRFWMSDYEAVQFVHRCLGYMVGGEIFVPALESATIQQVAECAFPNKPVKITGLLRPGEKLHETLIGSDELGRVFREPSEDSYFVILPEPAFVQWETDYSGYEQVFLSLPYCSDDPANLCSNGRFKQKFAKELGL